jgi:hypothetical protein
MSKGKDRIALALNLARSHELTVNGWSSLWEAEEPSVLITILRPAAFRNPPRKQADSLGIPHALCAVTHRPQRAGPRQSDGRVPLQAVSEFIHRRFLSSSESGRVGVTAEIGR